MALQQLPAHQILAAISVAAVSDLSCVSSPLRQVLENFVAVHDAHSQAQSIHPGKEVCKQIVGLLASIPSFNSELLLLVLKLLKILSRSATFRTDAGQACIEHILPHLRQAVNLRVAAEGVNVLLNVCYNKDNVTTLVSEGGVRLLIDFLQEPDHVLLANAAGAIQSVCYQYCGRKRVLSLGGVAPLLQLLDSDQPKVLERAVAALHNLSSDSAAIKFLRSHHAIPKFVALLESPCLRSAASAAGALQNMAREVASRMLIMELQATGPLTKLLSCVEPRAQVCAAGALLNIMGPDLDQANDGDQLRHTTSHVVSSLLSLSMIYHAVFDERPPLDFLDLEAAQRPSSAMHSSTHQHVLACTEDLRSRDMQSSEDCHAGIVGGAAADIEEPMDQGPLSSKMQRGWNTPPRPATPKSSLSASPRSSLGCGFSHPGSAASSPRNVSSRFARPVSAADATSSSSGLRFRGLSGLASHHTGPIGVALSWSAGSARNACNQAKVASGQGMGTRNQTLDAVVTVPTAADDDAGVCHEQVDPLAMSSILADSSVLPDAQVFAGNSPAIDSDFLQRRFMSWSSDTVEGVSFVEEDREEWPSSDDRNGQKGRLLAWCSQSNKLSARPPGMKILTSKKPGTAQSSAAASSHQSSSPVGNVDKLDQQPVFIDAPSRRIGRQDHTPSRARSASGQPSMQVAAACVHSPYDGFRPSSAVDRFTGRLKSAGSLRAKRLCSSVPHSPSDHYFCSSLDSSSNTAAYPDASSTKSGIARVLHAPDIVHRTAVTWAEAQLKCSLDSKLGLLSHQAAKF